MLAGQAVKLFSSLWSHEGLMSSSVSLGVPRAAGILLQ